MATQSRLIFVNVPTRGLPASTAFFRELGFAFVERFTDDSAACMVVSDQAYVMLLTESRFADFTTKPVAPRAPPIDSLSQRPGRPRCRRSRMRARLRTFAPVVSGDSAPGRRGLGTSGPRSLA